MNAVPAAPLSAAALCGRLARSHPREIALLEGERSCTFAELDARSDHLAAALLDAGIRPGERVAMLMHSGIALLEIYFAAAKARAIALPLNWRLAPAELGWIVTDAAPALLFLSAELTGLADGFECQVPRILVAQDTAQDDYESFLAGGRAALPQVAEDDTWIMLYTSGTTGRPKGCLLDQKGQVISAMASALQWRARPGDRVLMALPLFHVGGLGILFAHLVVGATVVIAPRHFSAIDALELLHTHKCTRSAIAPQLYLPLVEAQRMRQLPLCLQLLSMGGGMHPPEEIAAVRDALGADILLGYGQTECGNFVSYLSADEQMAHPRSCGRPMAHLDVMIADEKGAPVEPGGSGELLVRGASTLRGYWHQPEASAVTLQEGWVHTGDLFSVDEEGFLTLLGRLKELIKTGGENVYPKEVELALREHPAIADCSVFGVPHAHWGEAVKAAVVVQEGAALTAADVVAWCRQRIAGYKRPRYVEFLGALPRSDTGKLLMRELRERAVTQDQETA
ncbi:class I adenylate-forming enzyme family protein [Novosphingobium sp. P6W]|uniref:class I adenylate-forming enzyme family protein n=1 Tax=Novosphingobium sp. P6W TaxID=1609758 RepID=UPI0005C2EAD3|nr:AMP-binding protein [Novosphingobium sp. P6W]AXB80196.1 hypothetical protein TQ38_026760 [Novosphingobium sp. P6W]KIS31551.1 hypothetical protein TQ38_15535 [Novosphingobium sp. P6W]